jgi:hypothetical protein
MFPLKILCLCFLFLLTGCATVGDSAAISFAKDTGCPRDQVQYQALKNSTNLYNVNGCGQAADYICHNQNEKPRTEPKTDMIGTPNNPIVCTRSTGPL